MGDQIIEVQQQKQQALDHSYKTLQLFWAKMNDEYPRKMLTMSASEPPLYCHKLFPCMLTCSARARCRRGGVHCVH